MARFFEERMTATPEETQAAASDAEATPAKPKSKQWIPKPTGPKLDITVREWGRIRARWEEGGVTYKDLVIKYGHSAKTFERHFKKHGCVKGAKARRIQEHATKAIERDELNDAQVIAARVRETKDEHYKMSSALARLTWNEVLQAKQSGLPFATTLNNLKALNVASSNLRICREERFAILGLDKADAVDVDQIPELVIRELTAEQIEQLRARDHLDVDGAAPRAVDPALLPRSPEPDDDDEVEGA